MSLLKTRYKLANRNYRNFDSLDVDDSVKAIMADIGLDRTINDNILLVNAMSGPAAFVTNRDNVYQGCVEAIVAMAKKVDTSIKNVVAAFPQNLLDDINRQITADVSKQVIAKIRSLVGDVDKMVMQKMVKN